ncbi:MAG: hypothetical protein J6R85_02525 [Lentisphaeria bacterium]|nr:hypothetical protein [Lentisphaeria bacterium]MBO5959536.1 hypothetical protein [Lentisphaeria bacterium]
MADSKTNLKEFYSCKRKPDVVTAVAIVLFLIVILMQIYLVAILPIQLRQAETLEYNVSRDQMLLNVDTIRSRLNNLKTPDDLATGEVQMLRYAFDRLMLYTRENRDGLDLAQVGELTKRFRMFGSAAQRWKESKYYLREEKVEQKKYVRMLEAQIRAQETVQK